MSFEVMRTEGGWGDEVLEPSAGRSMHFIDTQLSRSYEYYERGDWTLATDCTSYSKTVCRKVVSH